MHKVPYTYRGIELEVAFYNDGEPYEIRNLDGEDIQHLFISSVSDEIYSLAWGAINDPNNEADFRREELI